METVREVPTINEVLERLRAKHGSLYAAAQKMQINLRLLSNYKHGRSLPDDAMAIKLADELGLPRAFLLAQFAAERAEKIKNPEAATVWRDLAKKMGVKKWAVAFITTGAALLLTSQLYDVSPLSPADIAGAPYAFVYYVKLRRHGQKTGLFKAYDGTAIPLPALHR